MEEVSKFLSGGLPSMPPTRALWDLFDVSPARPSGPETTVYLPAGRPLFTGTGSLKAG
jgi:hypothetical protein